MSAKIASYRFQYVRARNDVLRPMLRIKLRHAGRETTPVLVLVDTGADRCIFDDRLLLLLGLNAYEVGASGSATGIGGLEEIALFPIEVVFPDLEELSWEIHAQFKRLPDGIPGALGHAGFLGRMHTEFLYGREFAISGLRSKPTNR